MPIKSFRGNIIDGVVDTIPLHTNDGSTGYRIVKFECMFENHAGLSTESTFKIYSIKQTTVDASINFSDQTLLAAAFIENSSATTTFGGKTIIFDNMIFNQDIYVTYSEAGNAQSGNYYIELEQIKLDLNENTVATLKDIRNIQSQ
jgi:hypothetical protein